MSHYSVAVIVPPHIHDPENYVNAMLEPFSELLKVDPYIYMTREELLDEAKKNKAKAMLPENADEDYYDKLR